MATASSHPTSAIDLNEYRRAIRSSMMDVIEQSARLADRIPAEDKKIQRIAREAHEALFRQESAIQMLSKAGAEEPTGTSDAQRVLDETHNISLTLLAELQAIARRRAAFGQTESLPTWKARTGKPKL